jgi:hypothetical protein
MLEYTLGANRKLYRKIGMLPYSISPLSLTPTSPKHTIITALLEKLTARQLVKKSSSFYAVRKFITVFKTARHFSLTEARLILSTPTILCPWVPLQYYHRICTYVFRVFASGFHHQNSVRISPLSNACYMPRPTSSFITRIMLVRRDDIEAPHCEFFSISLLPLPSWSQMSSSAPSLEHPQPTFFPQCDRPSFTPIQKRQNCRWVKWLGYGSYDRWTGDHYPRNYITLSPTASRQALGLTLRSIERLSGNLSLLVKRPERGARQSSQRSADVKDISSCTFTSQRVLLTWRLIKDRRTDIFTIYVLQLHFNKTGFRSDYSERISKGGRKEVGSEWVGGRGTMRQSGEVLWVDEWLSEHLNRTLRSSWRLTEYSDIYVSRYYRQTRH